MSPAPTPPRLTIIEDHPDWLVLYKPEGIGMHTENDVPGLVVLASAQLNMPLYPVHRLDKVTSGLLLLAKNAATAARLSRLFAEHSIRKYYLARSNGKPVKKQGWVKGDMEKGRRGCHLLKRSMTNPAVTRFISSYDEASGKRLFLLLPLTGKTHQLRVAMKSLSVPIDGDDRYGGQPADRTYLHAGGLCWQDEDGAHHIFTPPHTGQWPDLPAGWQQPWTQISV